MLACPVGTVFFLLVQSSFYSFVSPSSPPSPPPLDICIVGGGISGSSVAHFLRRYSPPTSLRLRLFERRAVVGGRMATVVLAGETFEAGASILHPKNFYTANFTKMLNLTVKKPPPSESSLSLGIWDGEKFLFKTLDSNSKSSIVQRIVAITNSLHMLVRYGFSLFKMDSFVQNVVDNFLKYYASIESRPVFETVDEMLKWAYLYNLTARTLQDELVDAGLSPLLLKELVTVITRINYGQSVNISGLAGAVSLAGSGSGLWSVEEGNWQIAAGLIGHSGVALHVDEEIESVSFDGEGYELNSTGGNSHRCHAAVIAAPLDELRVRFHPPVSIPKRKLQHTHATFVRGLLNPAYFGLAAIAEVPELVGTLEDPSLPFSSISVLRKHDEGDFSYKIFSRHPMADVLLDHIFSLRKETIRLDWGAYPRYSSPEVFAPFVLDGRHLYYVNAFENAASTIETSAVAAENIARLILSRFPGLIPSISKSPNLGQDDLHSDL